MRILFVGKASLSTVGGAETSTRLLVTALARRGHGVALVTSVRRRSVQGVIDQAVVTSTGRVLEHVASDAGYLAATSISPSPDDAFIDAGILS